MTLTFTHLEEVDQHWAVKAIGEGAYKQGLEQANESLVKINLQHVITPIEDHCFDPNLLERLAIAYELAAIEGLEAFIHPANSEESQILQNQARAGAHRAFGLKRILPIPNETSEARIFHVLHLAGLGYCGDRWVDVRRWLEEDELSQKIPSMVNINWDQRLLYNLYDAWVRLLRKKNWEDLNQVSEIIINLRKEQKIFEENYLTNVKNDDESILALRLVALYHWAKATERLAEYMLQGEPASINTELDQHFEAAYKAAENTQDHQFEMILRWLHVASRQMVSGSVWWVAHTVNSRVTSFVKHITKKARGMFELLPPQRVALHTGGLLNQAHRAVVIDMPTSGGKTALAQFRILQALNQFAQDNAWIAYIAPTRALVSQITRRLREDFSPLGIKVEQLTGAVEIDAFEETLLEQKDAFQILVATPEKLQLVMRNKKISRPLVLVVMDEAQNIEDTERGLRIELLLSTIKQECSRANFLLLMPFVPNAKDLAHWLGDGRGASISLSSSPWQPNERIVGMFDIQKPISKKKNGDWNLEFETLITTQQSIHLRGKHRVAGNRPLSNLNYTKAKGLSTQAGAMAKVFSVRGTSVVVTQKTDDAWNVARKLYQEMPTLNIIHEDIALVQRFLKTEISENFELIEMLSKGIAVHHSGLPSEVLALIEWLTEKEHIKVLCATTTIAQGLNFPVSSVFLATRKYIYDKEMSHRAFWNLAGRAGRVGHGSIGVVGIAAGDNPNEVRKYVESATGALISRLVEMLDELEKAGSTLDLSAVFSQDQWADFRCYIAHLWNEKKNLEIVIGEVEQLLRGTYGYSTLRKKSDANSNSKADAVLEITKDYIRKLADHPQNASLADSTGFSPEGARTALLELKNLENRLQITDWQPNSLFGDNNFSVLPQLFGVMMKIPQLSFEGFSNNGEKGTNIAEVTQAWVAGQSVEAIARAYFKGETTTEQISKACKAIYRDIANSGAWGLSALSKMPTSGLNFENMSEEEKRKINNLPAMIYHGVRSEEAVLMRMNSVPRSIAEQLGETFKAQKSKPQLSSTIACEFLKSLQVSEWDNVKPAKSAMSGADYQKIWKRLSGL